jgi:hypothetical protein
MRQLTLAAAVRFERYAKTTRRATFLSEMERVVPWSALCGLIEPFYPKTGNGRPPRFYSTLWGNLMRTNGSPRVWEATTRLKVGKAVLRSNAG